MEKFFNPRGVAVVGASRSNISNYVVKNLVDGYGGGIYPVNPNYTELEGLACYGSVTDIPGPVDLAVVLVPARVVPSVLKACAKKEIRRVIIESAGFSETGEEGKAIQDQCEAIAADAGIRLWGPNCMGVVDVIHNRFFTFMNPEVREELLPGRITLIVQSGMMSAIFLAELGRRGIGVAKACSIGNRADVDECDIIEYLQEDPDTDVIALYLESIPRGRRFAELARESRKPLVLLKGGESRAGKAAAVSHTYSLSGDSRLLDSVLGSAGVVRAGSIYQMMDMADALAAMPHINPQCRTVILTLSGGAGILACDALERSGITIAELSEATRAEAGKIFPPWMPVSNPVDLFPAVSLNGRKAAFYGAFSAVLKDPELDVLVIHFVAGIEDAAPDLQEVRKLADQHNKVIVFWLMGRAEGSRQFRQDARKAGIQVYEDVTRLAECLRAVAVFSAHREEPPGFAETVAPAARPPLPAEDATWDEFDSKRLLADWEVPVVAEMLADTAEQAEAAARDMGYPVVLKGLARGRAHKTEHGLVKLGISGNAMLSEAYGALLESLGRDGRILVQKQVSSDYELIAGFIRDPQFGDCVMFGLGGILAELEPDVVFGLSPLSEREAAELVRSIRNYRLFTGFRGFAPLDEKAAARVLVRLGEIGAAYPQIEQIDINPLLVHKGSPIAVDASIMLKA